MPEKRPSSAYASVLDIPFYRDMYQQMRAIKPLLLFSPNLRKQMKDVERKLRESVRVVDGFYELLGPRHWVFHGHLNTDDIDGLLHLSPEEAEQGLIRIYNEGDWLSFWVRRIGNNPMSSWRGAA